MDGVDGVDELDYDQDGEGACLPGSGETEGGDPMGETAKHRHLVAGYCQGNGVDLGSGNDPVVPWAIQVELPTGQYNTTLTFAPEQRAQWLGSAIDLPFRDRTLDWVHSSHLLEDFHDWEPILAEWDRVLKEGGFQMIAVPDHARFRAAVAAGQGDNLAHVHESHIGELSERLRDRYDVLFDGFVSDDPREYSILFIGRKRRAA